MVRGEFQGPLRNRCNPSVHFIEWMLSEVASPFTVTIYIGPPLGGADPDSWGTLNLEVGKLLVVQ